MSWHRVSVETEQKHDGFISSQFDCSSTSGQQSTGYIYTSKDGWVLEHSLSYYGRNRVPLPRNPFTKSVIEVSRPFGFYIDTLRTPDPLITCNRSYSGAGVAAESDIIPGHSFSNNLVTLATNKAIRNANDSRSNVGADFGERRQNANMILGVAKRIGGAFNDVRHGNFYGAARYLGVKYKPLSGVKDLGSAWLAMKYGWLPLLEDVYNTFETLHPIDDKDSIRAIGTSRDHNEYVVTYSSGATMYTQRVSSKGSARCELAYFVSDGDLLRAGQIGLTNPLSVAWELVPYSFIVDWFIPIGSYFESLGNLALIFRGGSVTLKSVTTDKRSASIVDGNAAAGVRRDGYYEFGGSNFSLERTVFSAAPTFVPIFKNPFSVSHGLNFAALLSQALGSFKKSS